MAIKSTDSDLWHVIAGRNLCLAEDMELDIVSLCNGCYNTLKTVNSTLKSDDKLRTSVNKILKDLDLEFKGTIEVKHIIEVLESDVGPNAIENHLKRPLAGLRAAPFFGCHVIRPEDHLGFDDPKNPQALDRMVRLLGIKTVSYPERNSCCGGGLKIARAEDALNYSRKLLQSMKANGANCVVVSCPYCMVQLEFSQAQINDVFNEEIDMPVFYYTELLGLTLGYSPQELGLEMHSELGVKNIELLTSILGPSSTKELELFNDAVTKDQLEVCQRCGACADDCSAASTSDFHPEELIELALEGNLNELINRKDIWYCMNCHDCIEHCPQGFGIVNLIFRLKNLAIAHGIYPEVISHRDTEFAGTGFGFEPNHELRDRLGLPPVTGAKSKDIRKIIKRSGIQAVIHNTPETEKGI
jgi:heterodisulfide reductase subunit B